MTRKVITLIFLLTILSIALCSCAMFTAQPEQLVQTVEGTIANISEKNFLIIDKSKEKPVLIARVNFCGFLASSSEYETRSFEEAITTECFLNSKDETLNYFTVDGVPFYNGDKVSLEYLQKVGDRLESVSKIVFLEMPEKGSGRAFLEKLYNAGQNYMAAEAYSEAFLCFERIGEYNDAQEQAVEAHNADLARIEGTDLVQMQGMWHSIEYCSGSGYAECDFIEIKGLAIANRAHSYEPSYGDWFTGELDGETIKVEWVVTEETNGEVTKESTETWTLSFEDDHLVNQIKYQDGTKEKIVYYKTTSEEGQYTEEKDYWAGGTCAKSGCSENAVTTGDSVYCVAHSNRCLNCFCYIDGDAMYCMSCIKSALS